jgi:hypothetical protein
MPLTTQESVGLGMNVLNIWHRHVTAHTLRQMDLVMNQYVDDRIIAYMLREDDETMGIRVVNISDLKNRKFVSENEIIINET